ncbi:MAG: transporter [Naasia sp.]|uniref:MFS transporter n=1 Tax=Naasia sp. TaxID=2546198 RepID=UPI0026125AC2|nr:MFS transporter [Naasia sp.]MCU1570380.1 transporter [Naasia sp.]
MRATFRSLGRRNYRLWFFGGLISNIGAWMQRTAQDWIVLTELTHQDAFAVGVTMALQFGPLLVLGPFAGVLVDRFDGRRLMAITQGAQALLALGLGVLTLSGSAQLWMVYAFALALGVVTAVDNPVRQTFVAELVPAKDLPNAVALNAASFNGARLIGPAAAGIAVAAFGPGWVFLLNAATFAAVLVALALLRTGELRPLERPARGRGGMLEGLRYVRGRPDVLVLLTMVFLVGTFGLNFPIFTSTMARIEFHQGAGEFGLLSSILAIGSLTGALGAANRNRPRLRVIVVAAGGFGLACTAAALMPSYWTFAGTLVVVGACSMVMTTSANAYVQTTTPAPLRGRVMSLYMAIFAGTTLIGAPIVGWVASAFGPRWSLGVAAASGILAMLVGATWFAVRHSVRMSWHPRSRWPLGLTMADADGIPGAPAARSRAELQTTLASAESVGPR